MVEMTSPVERPQNAAADASVLQVSGLSVEFRNGPSWTRVVDDVSFSVGYGEAMGLVGESGSGKSVTSLAICGLIGAQGGRTSGGQITLCGRSLNDLDEAGWRQVRGGRIGMIFQQPSRSLNPAFTVGDQIAESVRVHRKMSRKAAWERAVEMLDRVHIASASKRAHDYPHMFSGGMCQRVMIAMALACEPQLLIADEPTTALDVTVQARVLDLLRGLQDDYELAILFITHDLGVVAEMCERTAVMYAGQIVEVAETDDLLLSPRHPYSAGLLASVPQVGHPLAAIRGVIPSFSNLPGGCRFHPRCEHSVQDVCDTVPIELREVGGAPGTRACRCARSEELHLDGVTPSVC